MEEYREDCIRGITESMREGKPFNMALIVICNTEDNWMRFSQHGRKIYALIEKTNMNNYCASILRAAADGLEKDSFNTVVSEFVAKEDLNS